MSIPLTLTVIVNSKFERFGPKKLSQHALQIWFDFWSFVSCFFSYLYLTHLFLFKALQKNPSVRPSAKHLLNHPWIQLHAPEIPDIPAIAEQPHLLLQSLSLSKPSTVEIILSDSDRESSRLLTTDSMGIPQLALPNTNNERISRTGSNASPSPLGKIAIRTSPLISGNIHLPKSGSLSNKNQSLAMLVILKYFLLLDFVC